MRFLFFLVICLCSQSLIAQQLIYFLGANGKFGYKDINGKIIVQPKYDKAYSMNNGIALVKNGGKKALIDITGKEITPFKYDYILNFKEDLAAVNIGGIYDSDEDNVFGGKWGYINKKGIEITPIKYDYAYDFVSGLAKVEINNSILFIDKTGKEVTAAFQTKTEQDNAVYVPTKPLAKPIGKLIKYQDNNKKYGLKDSKGTIIIAPKFDDVEKFENGIAKVYIGVNFLYRKYGYIDSLGNEVIPVKYYPLSAYNEGLICAGLDNKYGFFDKTGKTIIPFKYKYANAFKDGLALVQLENDLYGYIDRNDKLIIPAIYNKGNNFIDGMTLVNLKDKWGFINKSGKVVIPIIYDDAYVFSEGLAAVNKGAEKSGYALKGGKYGFINTSGEVVVPLIYDQVNPFSEGLACVTQNNKSGFIDKTGKVIIPLQYEYRTSFDYGKAYVTLNGKSFYIDKAGKETTPSKRITFTNGYYVGEYKDTNIRNGKGKMVWENGDTYEGEWLNDETHGKGKITYANGNIYEGDFVNGKFVKASAGSTINTTENNNTKKPDVPTVSHILNEDFTDNRNQWATGSNNDASTSISNGQYIYEMKQSYYHFNWLPGNVLTKINQQKDFTMETQFSVLSGYEEYPVWFLWGHKDMQNQFAFSITATGKYEYSKKVNDVVTVIVPSKSSTAIKTGKNAANKLSVKKAGNKIEFYINDVLVDNAPYENFNPQTTVGLLLQNQKKIAVDYIRITQ